MALTQKQVRRLELYKAYWRPVAGYVVSLCVFFIVSTMCWLVLRDPSLLNVVITFFTAAIPSFMAFLGAQAVGRSYEKANDSAHYSIDDMKEDEEGDEWPEGIAPPDRGGLNLND